MTNGHHSRMENTSITNDEASYDSGSDLSEIREPPVVEASPSSSSTPNHQSDFGNEDPESSESSEDEKGNGSEDGDFDVEESVPEPNRRNTRVDRSSSHDSRRPTKRKMGIEDDEYIKANPELYGLRRSVRNHCALLEESFNMAF